MIEILNWLALFGIYISLFASIFFLYTFFESKQALNGKEPKEWPSVTIAVPTYNDADTIAKTVESLLALDYPREKLQLLIVENNNSTDGTYEIARQFESRGVEVYTIPQGGKGPALNFALAKARGEFFGGLDSDSIVEPDALKKLIAHFTAKNIMAVTPALKVYSPKSFLGRIQQIEYMMGVFLRRVFASLDSIHVTPGPLTVYRKEFFDKYGGYDEHNITEDLEIAMRIQSKRFKIRNAIDANVYAANPETWSALARQRVRWYIGFVENMAKYKELFHPKYGVLAVYILPMAFISVFLAMVFSAYSFYSIAVHTIAYPSVLKAINYNVLAAAKDWLSQIASTTPDVKTILAIPLITFSMIMLYAAKTYSKESRESGLKLGILFIPYGIAYIYIFSIWWMMALGYKLFARKPLRFGGTVWQNSVLNNLLSRSKNEQC
jgi:cellulose synthase/poly-beta-1,6-N-acetylglucosamine synthase-like glycosyltransferase